MLHALCSVMTTCTNVEYYMYVSISGPTERITLIHVRMYGNVYVHTYQGIRYESILYNLGTVSHTLIYESSTQIYYTPTYSYVRIIKPPMQLRPPMVPTKEV